MATLQLFHVFLMICCHSIKSSFAFQTSITTRPASLALLSASVHEKKDSYIYTCLDEETDDIISNNNNNIGCQRDLQRVLHTIEKAAYSAGEIALSTAGKIAVKATKANARDLVTESDLKCQNLIKEIILSEFPNDVFLGEEGLDLKGDSSSASSNALKGALGIAEEDYSGNVAQDKLLFIVVSDYGTYACVHSPLRLHYIRKFPL